MEEGTRKLHWNEQLETLIAEEGEKARGYAWIHSKAEQIYAYYDSLISLPVIILSTLAGACSVGSFLPESDYTNVAVGGVSILVGILNTIGSRFAFAKRSEGHRVAQLSYSKLFSFLSIELALPRDERMNPTDLIKMLRETTERLAQTSPTLPPKVLKWFHESFEKEQAAKPPETNGLARIRVFQGEGFKTPVPPTLKLPSEAVAV